MWPFFPLFAYILKEKAPSIKPEKKEVFPLIS